MVAPHPKADDRDDINSACPKKAASAAPYFGRPLNPAAVRSASASIT
jgi:hypothetical protein